MQTSPWNSPVYFCWAAGGNMCLTSVSLTRRSAAGLRCPLAAAPLKWTGDNGWFQRAPVITVQSMSSCLRTALLTKGCFFFFFFDLSLSHVESVLAAVYSVALKKASGYTVNTHARMNERTSIACVTPQQTLQLCEVMSDTWSIKGRARHRHRKWMGDIFLGLETEQSHHGVTARAGEFLIITQTGKLFQLCCCWGQGDKCSVASRCRCAASMCVSGLCVCALQSFGCFMFPISELLTLVMH